MLGSNTGNMKKFTVMGICGGQGSLLFPFRKHLIANIEPRGVFHSFEERQWKLNFGDIPFIKGFKEDFPHPNVILSSPDCGASSIMRLSKVKKLGNPEKNKSLNLVIQGILHYKPEYFLIENLPRLLTLIPKENFESIFSDYTLLFHCHSVMEFGNSQSSRKRLVIIGIKNSLKRNKKYFENIFRVKEPKLARNLLEAAYFKGNNENYMPSLNKTLAMYDYRLLPQKINLTVREIQKLWTNDFKDEKKWPIKTKKMSTLPGVYRLEEDKYPLTVRPADRQFRPDGYPLGVQDIKNIMGFPKRFKIFMDLDHYEVFRDPSHYDYWLNKARYTLAKGSVYEVGLWFKKCLLHTC